MSRRHGEVDEETRAGLWREVKEMYQGIDAILGEILAHADPDTTVVFSSDHGIVPLDFEVRLNNLFARKGWLFDRINADTGEYEIDWDRTRVIYLTMDNVYINPDGLGGNYHRAKGPAYEKLRREVIEALSELHDEHGVNPVAKIVPWERAEAELALPADRIGDLVIANRPTYGWEEEVSADRKVFHPALKSGYKQAILPSEVEGMLTPFAIMGPGVRAGHRMGQPIRHIDQYPTIMELLGLPIPAFVEGKPIAEVRKGR
jgi:arylsulfatase A-like enzyme